MTRNPIEEKFRRGFREKDAFQDQRRLCSAARVIFDVGANQGQTSKKYRDLFPSANIRAFEPFPNVFRVLDRRFQNDSLVDCEQFALGDKQGPRRFHTYEASVTNSLMPFVDSVSELVPMATELEKAIEVEGATLDQYCASNNIDHIDILKMDTQGAELEILKGAEGMLSEKRISLIYTEHIFVPLYRGQAEFHEVLSEMARYGFALFDFYSFVYANSGQLKWGDAIYLADAR